MAIFYKELDTGNLEYKLNMDNMTYEKFQRYSTQLKYRVLEGNGNAIYIIGITDNGNVVGLNNYKKTINIFNNICLNVKCNIKLILKCYYTNKIFLIIKVESKFDLDSVPFNLNI